METHKKKESARISNIDLEKLFRPKIFRQWIVKSIIYIYCSAPAMLFFFILLIASPKLQGQTVSPVTDSNQNDMLQVGATAIKPLEIKLNSPYPLTMVNEQSGNGNIGYVPNRKAFPEGSYEVISARFSPGGGEKLVNAAIRRLIAIFPHNDNNF